LNRKGILFGFATGALVLGPASIAFACVIFVGSLTVDGHDGDTTVVGKGNAHDYCTTGRPTTAAAGHVGDTVSLAYGPGSCADSGTLTSYSPPDGVYEVRYNNADAYNVVGGTWTLVNGTGCFNSANARTTTLLGAFTVSGGSGAWTGTIVTAGTPAPLGLGDAHNFCVGAPTLEVPGGDPGMLAPFRLLPV